MRTNSFLLIKFIVFLMKMNWILFICLTVMVSPIHGQNRPYYKGREILLKNLSNPMLPIGLIATAVLEDAIHFDLHKDHETQMYGLNVLNLNSGQKIARSKNQVIEDKNGNAFQIIPIVLNKLQSKFTSGDQHVKAWPQPSQDFKYPVKQALGSDVLDNVQITQFDAKKPYYNFGKENKLQNVLKKLKLTNQPRDKNENKQMVIIAIDPSKLLASKENPKYVYDTKNNVYLRAQPDNKTDFASVLTTYLKNIFHIDKHNRTATKLYGINIINWKLPYGNKTKKNVTTQFGKLNKTVINYDLNLLDWFIRDHGSCNRTLLSESQNKNIYGKYSVSSLNINMDATRLTITDNRTMGGITVVFGCDFRQTLPVVTRGTRADEENIDKSKFMEKFQSAIKNKINENANKILNGLLGEPIRRNWKGSNQVILGVPRRPEHLPKALPILPGHTLLRPAKGMLKSSVKYPMRDFGGAAVYGNLDNIGITLGKTRQRIRYTDFRKANNLLDLLQNSVQSSKSNKKDRGRPLIIIEIDPSKLGTTYSKGDVLEQLYENRESDEENRAIEIFDEPNTTSDSESNGNLNLRRARKSKYRDRKINYKRKSRETSEQSKGSETASSSSEVEKNPGNPHTIYKNKYKQNWMWNHVMDGQHMNINPLAPELNEITPSGEDLFFARKWWYFNQDDFKPMG